MVQVAVRNHDGIQPAHVESKGRGVAALVFAAALQQAAIQQDFCVLGFEQVLRASNAPGRPEKSQFCHEVTPHCAALGSFRRQLRSCDAPVA